MSREKYIPISAGETLIATDDWREKPWKPCDPDGYLARTLKFEWKPVKNMLGWKVLGGDLCHLEFRKLNNAITEAKRPKP